MLKAPDCRTLKWRTLPKVFPDGCGTITREEEIIGTVARSNCRRILKFQSANGWELCILLG